MNRRRPSNEIRRPPTTGIKATAFHHTEWHALGADAEKLAPAALAHARAAATQARAERERLRMGLLGAPGMRRVYPSQGNFLLARFIDAQAAFDALLDAGVVVRDMRATAGLGDALRISIGTPAQNDRVLAVLADARQAA